MRRQELQDVRCALESCEHPLKEHGVNGVCYGTVKLLNGAVGDCACKKFRVPTSE